MNVSNTLIVTEIQGDALLIGKHRVSDNVMKFPSKFDAHTMFTFVRLQQIDVRSFIEMSAILKLSPVEIP